MYTDTYEWTAHKKKEIVVKVPKGSNDIRNKCIDWWSCLLSLSYNDPTIRQARILPRDSVSYMAFMLEQLLC